MADTPHYNVSINTNTRDDMEEGCREVINLVRPTWPVTQIQIKVFTDGLTNKLVGGWFKDKQDTVLVRIYGENTDKFIDRESEKENMKRMETAGCGSKLYASFQNGLSYEFVHGKVLEPSILFDPRIYREVAKCVARMHKVKINASSASMWSFLEKLIKLYPDSFPDPKKVSR